MFKAVEKTSLAFDRFAEIIIHAKRLFDRHRAAKTHVRRDIHRTHAALADLLVDLITLL